MAKRVVAVNPAKPRKKKNMAAKANPKTNPTPTRRRRRRRRNPAIHPALMATLGTLAGAAAGGGGDIALRYTSLSPYMRGGILAGVGVAAGVGLSFLDPSLGAGVGGGLGSVGVSEIILQATAPSPGEEAAASAELAAVKAEIGRVRAELGGAIPKYPALEQADPNADVVYVDEEDMAYLG